MAQNIWQKIAEDLCFVDRGSTEAPVRLGSRIIHRKVPVAESCYRGIAGYKPASFLQ